MIIKQPILLKNILLYVIFTVGQVSGYYNSPNKTYDKYTNHIAGEKCSVRDLPMDLAKALHKKGIDLILYIPGEPPPRDTLAALALGAAQSVSNDAGVNWVYNDTIVRRWSNVVQEWSDRYGSLIKGWWVDGCYRESDFKDTHAKVLSVALKHGNPKNIVSFNSGLNYNRVGNEDYLAGEENNILGAYCAARSSDGAQWHELSFLGSFWGTGKPRCTAKQLTDYLNNKINKNGGILTIEVPLDKELEGCRLSSQHLAILKEVKTAIR